MIREELLKAIYQRMEEARRSCGDERQLEQWHRDMAAIELAARGNTEQVRGLSDITTIHSECAAKGETA